MPPGFAASVRPLPVHHMDSPMYVVRAGAREDSHVAPILIFALKMGFGSKASYGKNVICLTMPPD